MGREAELAAIEGLFGKGARLVTLLGPAGNGKTRLACRYAERYSAASSHGVYFCDLTEARSVDDILATFAAAFGVPIAPGSSRAELAAQLGHVLAARRPALVVADNFDHLTQYSAETLGAWLAGDTPAILVTSRARLGLTGEASFDVDALRLEDACDLFQDRARLVLPSFTMDAAAQELVQRLEGNALAIELAAARVNVLPPKKLLARFSSRLDLLKSAQRDATPRHITLRAAIDASWDLLAPEERDALAACAVFRGGFTLEAAEAVLRCPSVHAVVDLVDALLAKSLLRRFEPAEPGREVRFGLYESVREYAAQKLEASGAGDRSRTRHAEYYVALVERARADVPRGSLGPSPLIEEADNLLAIARSGSVRDPRVRGRATLCLDWLLASRLGCDAHDALLCAGLEEAMKSGDARLVASLLLARGCANLRSRGTVGEAEHDLRRALGMARAEGFPDVEVRALNELARGELGRGSAGEALALSQEALAFARGIGDHDAEATALCWIGWCHAERGDVETAERVAHEGLAVSKRFERFGLGFVELQLRNLLGVLATRTRRLAQAERHFRDLLAMTVQARHHHAQAALAANVAYVLMESGQHAEASAQYDAALDVARRFGARRHEGILLVDSASLEHELGRPQEARRCVAEGLPILRDVDDRRTEALALLSRGRLDFEEGRVDDAAVDFESAALLVKPLEQVVMLGEILAWAGAAAAARDELDAARRQLAEAAACRSLVRDPVLTATLETLGGFLGLSLARAALSASDPEGAATHLADVDRRLVAAEPVASSSVHLRIAQRILQRARDAIAPRGASARLEIGPDARWIERDGKRVDLGGRKALRLLLLRLLEEQRSAPGTALSMAALFKIGWPGERIQEAAANRRVYTAIGTLRDLGLRDVLVHRYGGYLLEVLPAGPVSKKA